MAKSNSIKNITGKSLMQRISKIDSLPKSIQESIPFRGIMSNGIIETRPGTFTKTYHLKDANFTMLNEDEQISFMKRFMGIQTSFDEGVRWQYTIYNHEVDKRRTLEDICIMPHADGLNKYRKEMNEILTSNLKHGSSSLTQDKYLTIAIDDNNVDHAISTLNKNDVNIEKRFREIPDSGATPLRLEERLELMYNIYNQNYDYRLATGAFDGKDPLDLAYLSKCGLTIKDLIGPESLQFSDRSFMVGDKYAQAYCIKKIPSFLSTNFLRDICDIQTNSLISMTYEAIDSDMAVKMVKNSIATVEARVNKIDKRNSDDGYSSALPPELEKQQDAARDLMNDITNRDQKLFFMSAVIIFFADTKEALDNVVRIAKSISAKHQCPLMLLKYQQEFAFNTALPLCRMDLVSKTKILYTTESSSAFLPYNAIEINQKNALFYGNNKVTNSMLLYDRTSGGNYNGLIFGTSGSGKSMAAKNEMEQVRLKYPDKTQIFVIDPQGEYGKMQKAFNGLGINLAPGAKSYINPLDLNIADVEDEGGDPVAAKIDFVLSMVKTMNHAPLTSQEEAIITRAVTKLYDPYVRELEETGKQIDKTKCPTLSDLYHELDLQRNRYPETAHLCEILSTFTMGKFDNFAHRTNVVTDNNFVVYNIKSVGTKMRELAFQICLNDIWNRMIENSKNGIFTYIYIDEFHILLESDEATVMLKRIWKMARKWLGVPTGIMQNAADLLKNADTMAIFENTSFMIVLKGQLMDRNAFQQLLHLSSAQLEHITDSDAGHGLFYNGKMTVPFGMDFPRNTLLYSIMTTSHDEIKQEV